MTDRTVKVSLIAQVSNYVAGMEQAQKATQKTGTEAEKLAQKGKAISDFSQAAGVSLLAVGAAAAGFVALSVSKFAEFDQAMSEVQASTHESTTNMNLLRDAAVKAGADTVFSATEAANAEDELAKAGVSTADILGGALTGAMSLASAGSINVADAATIAATAMTQFKLSGSDVPHIADLLAAGAGKAQGSVSDLAMALNQGGLVASQAGQSIEDTTGVLAAFASAGLIGSDAGTSLKTMLLSLESPSTKAAGVMDTYGINVYDASGKMLSFAGIADQLKTKLGGLTDEQRNSALATIFGTDAVRSASVLYSQGASGISDWTSKVNDAGYASETAKLKLDNLNGDLEYLKGSIDTALINSGSAANDTLRALIQTLTGVVNTVGGLPAPVLGAGLAFAALVAVTGLLGGGFVTLIPKIAATKLAMQEMNLTGGTLAKGLGVGGVLALALVSVTAGFAAMGQTATLTAEDVSQLDNSLKMQNLFALSAQFDTGRRGVEGFQASLDQLYTSDFSKSEQANLAAAKFFKGASFGLADLAPDLTKTEAQFKSLGDTLAGSVTADFKTGTGQFNELVQSTDKSDTSLSELMSAFPQYKTALQDLAAQQGVTLSDQDLLNFAQGKGALAQQLLGDSAAKAATKLYDTSAAAVDTTGNIKDLSDSIKNFGKANFDVESATNSFYGAFDKLKSILDGGTGSLDQTTEAGRNTSQALLDTASSTNDLAAATLAQGGSTADVQAVLEQGRQKIIDTRMALGDTTEAAQAYADKLIATPAQVATAVSVTGIAQAQADVEGLLAWISSRVATINVRAALPDLNGTDSGTGRMGTFASGGAIGGNGGPTADDQIIRASTGEHMFDASDVAAMGGQSAVYAFRAALHGGKGKSSYGDPAANYMYAPPNYGVAAPSGSGGNRSATVNVYPTPGMSEPAIARVAVSGLNYELGRLP